MTFVQDILAAKRTEYLNIKSGIEHQAIMVSVGLGFESGFTVGSFKDQYSMIFSPNVLNVSSTFTPVFALVM